MLTRNDYLSICAIWVVDSLAIIANLLLITAIILRTPKHLRTYAVFLLNNAIIDLVTATASAMGTVRIVQDHEGFAMLFVFIGPCSLVNERICVLCQSIHMNLVQQSTIVLLLSFAFRLYIISEDVLAARSLKPLHVWLICVLSLALVAIPSTAYYLEQTSAPPEVLTKLRLDGYTASYYSIVGSTRAISLAVLYVMLSPIVMTLIFIVRRKLIERIERAKPTEKRLHLSIARVSDLGFSNNQRNEFPALAYQLLLPCGVAAAAIFWLCDVYQIWSSEFSERIVMVTCSMFSLASPIINFTMLPPYRAMIPFFQKAKSNVEAITNSTTRH